MKGILPSHVTVVIATRGGGWHQDENEELTGRDPGAVAARFYSATALPVLALS